MPFCALLKTVTLIFAASLFKIAKTIKINLNCQSKIPTKNAKDMLHCLFWAHVQLNRQNPKPYDCVHTVNFRFKKNLNLQIHLRHFFFARSVFRSSAKIFLKSNISQFKKGKMRFLKSRFACTSIELSGFKYCTQNHLFLKDLLRILDKSQKVFWFRYSIHFFFVIGKMCCWIKTIQLDLFSGFSNLLLNVSTSQLCVLIKKVFYFKNSSDL